MNSSGVEDHTLEGAVLNVLVVVGHMDLPLARLIRLEGCIEGSVIFRDGAPKRSMCWGVGGHLTTTTITITTTTTTTMCRGVGGHLQQVRPRRVVWVDQHLQVTELSFTFDAKKKPPQ